MTGRAFAGSSGWSKQKTRPDWPLEDPRPVAPAEAEEEPVLEAAANSTALAVRRNDYRVFEVVFLKGRQGQINFTQFRSAMLAAGFNSQQQGGSVWLFMHQTGDLPSIRFHMTHGTDSGKIDRTKLTNMAKDLERRYDWTMESFVNQQ